MDKGVDKIFNCSLFLFSKGCKITYNANGGTGTTPAQQSYTYGASVKINSNTGGNIDLKKSGYVFDGWNTAANGSGTKYVPGQQLSVTRESFTLYAQWKNVTTTLNFINSGLGLTKVRVYDTYGFYREYTSFDDIPVYPGGDVMLFHDSDQRCGWKVPCCVGVDGRTVTQYAYIGGDNYYFTIPADATGPATLYLARGVNVVKDRYMTDIQIAQVDASHGYGWALPVNDANLYSRYSTSTATDKLCYPWLCPFVITSITPENISSVNGSFEYKAYDKYGYCHGKFASSSSLTTNVAYPGGKVVLTFIKPERDVTWWYNTSYAINSQSIYLTVPTEQISKGSMALNFGETTGSAGSQNWRVVISIPNSPVPTGWLQGGALTLWRADE